MTHPTAYSIEYPELDTILALRMAREKLLMDHPKAIKVVADLFCEVARPFAGAGWPKMRASVRAGIIDALAAARVGTEPVKFSLSDANDPDNGVSISFPDAFMGDEGILMTDRGMRCLVSQIAPARWAESVPLLNDLDHEISRHSSTQAGMTFTQQTTPYGTKYPKYKAL